MRFVLALVLICAVVVTFFFAATGAEWFVAVEVIFYIIVWAAFATEGDHRFSGLEPRSTGGPVRPVRRNRADAV
ncbi:hypothetical protein BWI17_03745 [Betaproteobacteria bacterium GR16-43]|nr:hypothetical protein BWI17_03745 [Betaproteobacteria bacterium GR16-43]